MSLITDKLNTYINYLEKLKSDPKYEPNAIEKEANYYVNNDKSLKEVVSELNTTNDYLKRKEIINSYGSKTNNMIDISKISHYKLNNGNEVYSFIDNSGVRRVVENNKLGDISKQLNESDFIMEDMLRNNNNEINMVQIDEFLKDVNNFKNLEQRELENLKAIIANKDNMKIKYINKDNMLLMDENGNVLEAYYDENQNTSKIGSPDLISYNQDELSADTSLNSNEISNNSETNEGLKNEIIEGQEEEEKNNFSVEDIEKIKKEIEDKQIDVSLEDALKNIPLYYEVPTKIDSDFSSGLIDEKQKEFYENMTVLYAESLSKRQKNNMKKTLDLTKDTRGIASVFLLSIILFIIAVIILFNLK